MGLPGSGKTTFAKKLLHALTDNGHVVEWFNADDVRTKLNDWDFSHEGRLRQAKRMKELADGAAAEIVVVDFVCPLKEMRDMFQADWIIWLDTIPHGRFEDTNKMFEPPEDYDVRMTEFWDK